MQEKGEFYKAEFDITESAIAEFGIMCWCREFYIAEFNITESAIAKFGITESAILSFVKRRLRKLDPGHNQISLVLSLSGDYESWILDITKLLLLFC